MLEVVSVAFRPLLTVLETAIAPGGVVLVVGVAAGLTANTAVAESFVMAYARTNTESAGVKVADVRLVRIPTTNDGPAALLVVAVDAVAVVAVAVADVLIDPEFAVKLDHGVAFNVTPGLRRIVALP